MHLVSLLFYNLVYLRKNPVDNVVTSLFHFVNHRVQAAIDSTSIVGVKHTFFVKPSKDVFLLLNIGVWILSLSLWLLFSDKSSTSSRYSAMTASKDHNLLELSWITEDSLGDGAFTASDLNVLETDIGWGGFFYMSIVLYGLNLSRHLIYCKAAALAISIRHYWGYVKLRHLPLH